MARAGVAGTRGYPPPPTGGILGVKYFVSIVWRDNYPLDTDEGFLYFVVMSQARIDTIKRIIEENNATLQVLHDQVQSLPYGSPDRVTKEGHMQTLLATSKTLQIELNGLEKR